VFFKRRAPLPAGQRPALERDERVLALASTSDGRAVVATNRGLWLPDREGPPDVPGGRLGWHEIHKATWNPPRFAVTPAEQLSEEDGYLVMADLPELVFALDEPGELPAEVRSRIVRSVVHTSHHVLPEGGGLRVVGRRVSGVDGLSWHVRYDPDTGPDDPGVPEATAVLVAAARDEREEPGARAGAA